MAFNEQSAVFGRGPAIHLPSKKKEKVCKTFNAAYLQRLKDREEEIVRDFYSHFARRLQMKLRARRLQESDVQDIFHETIVRVLKAVDQDRVHTPDAFGGYVSGVCDNVLLDFWNHRSCDRCHIDIDEIDIPAPIPDIETNILCKERQELVAKILNDLSPR